MPMVEVLATVVVHVSRQNYSGGSSTRFVDVQGRREGLVETRVSVVGIGTW